ncbi:MAG: hypothetical protein RCG15_01215 [Candidatus Rickettsia vulgarisii]
MSDLTGVEIIPRGLTFDKSTTFDNPGIKPIVEKPIQNNLFTNKVEIATEDLIKHCEVYNAKPNFINNIN